MSIELEITYVSYIINTETIRTANAQTKQTKYLPGHIQIRIPIKRRVRVNELIKPEQYVISYFVYKKIIILS